MKKILNIIKSKKFIIGVLIVAFLAIVSYGYPKYQDWKFDREIKKLTEEINKPYLEDTYGGVTPQETLQMFIDAVEKGDYELASKYFVVEKQKEWEESLLNIEESDKFDVFLQPIKDTQNSKGEYSEDKDTYIVHNPVFVEFLLYPQGFWKINEI